jgi:hypothetical protein
VELTHLHLTADGNPEKENGDDDAGKKSFSRHHFFAPLSPCFPFQMKSNSTSVLGVPREEIQRQAPKIAAFLDVFE